MKPIETIAIISFAVVTCAVHAQQPAAPATSIPPLNCEKPGDGPGIQPTYEQQKRFQKSVESYKNCVDKYAAEMKKAADEHFEITKKYQEVGNAAIGEYNAYATQLNAQAGNKDEAGSGRPSVPASAPRSGGKY